MGLTNMHLTEPPGLFHTVWGYDPDGYELRGTLITGKIIRRKSPNADFMTYEPFVDATDAHRAIAKVSEADDPDSAAVEFVCRYGVLGNSFEDQEGDQPLDEFHNFQGRVADVLSLLRETKDRGLSKPIDAFNAYNGALMTVRIDPRKPRLPKMHVVPLTLKAFVWYLVGQEILDGVLYRKCANTRCQEYLPIGKNARRSNTLFCDQKCLMAAKRAKEKEING
jgi:hypothetical protein